MSGAWTGKTGEDIAAEYLTSKGMAIAARNYRIRGGEIDLIMRDGGTVVFVEVKTRAYGTRQSAFDAVPPAKRGRISRAAVKFLQENGLFETSCRFDVVIIIGALPDVAIEHYENAFSFTGGFFV